MLTNLFSTVPPGTSLQITNNKMSGKYKCLVCGMALWVTMQGYAQEKSSYEEKKSSEILLSFIAGMSPAAKRGLDYGSGFGVQAGTILNKFYVGGMLARHQGDEIKINYGGISNLGIKGGEQNYTWACAFLVADAGYRLPVLKTDKISAVLMPYISSGLGIINMKTSGVYGQGDNVVDKRLRFGGGAAYQASFGEHFSVGFNYRVYAPSDVSFEFGNGGNEIPHGFSTGVYYYAFFSEFSYRF
jgi:hypothetical protein